MTLRNTVDVAWRPDRAAWSVEGGDGTPAVLGIHSVHDSRAAAIEAARDVAANYDADVRVLNEEGDGYPCVDRPGTDHRESEGTSLHWLDW